MISLSQRSMAQVNINVCYILFFFRNIEKHTGKALLFKLFFFLKKMFSQKSQQTIETEKRKKKKRTITTYIHPSTCISLLQMDFIFFFQVFEPFTLHYYIYFFIVFLFLFEWVMFVMHFLLNEKKKDLKVNTEHQLTRVKW